MRWVPISYHNQKYIEQLRQGRAIWHRWYAWRPIYLPPMKADAIEVPGHYVWLEYIDRKLPMNYYEDIPWVPRIIWYAAVGLCCPTWFWIFRPYTGAMPIPTYKEYMKAVAGGKQP